MMSLSLFHYIFLRQHVFTYCQSCLLVGAGKRETETQNELNLMNCIGLAVLVLNKLNSVGLSSPAPNLWKQI